MQRAATIVTWTALGLGTLGLVGLLFLAAPAAAGQDKSAVQQGDEAALPDELRRDGWKVLGVPGKAPARFAQQDPGGIRLSAENAVAFLYRPVPGDMGVKRRLIWRWRVDESGAPTDLSKIGQDDRSLAVHLVFPLDADSLPFWERSGPTRCIEEPPLVTSSRRFEGRHPLAIVWGWLEIHALFHFGASPQVLARRYAAKRRGGRVKPSLLEADS